MDPISQADCRFTGPWTLGVRRVRLPNGVTVLIKRDDSAPVVAVVTHVRAGFFDEPDHWVGISHVLEHMFFKGTASRGVGEIARETKAAGGYLNASTGYDGTSYYMVLPASGLETALEIQADALRHSLIDAGELERELQVIIQEAKRKRDTAPALAVESLYALMFDRHRIRRWRIGEEAALAGFTRDDLWAYYRSRYAPSRTILAIVGDVDEQAALALAQRYYGDWAGAADPIPLGPEEPPHTGVRVRTLRGDIRQAELAVGWHTVPPLHPDAHALDLAGGVLSAGRGSWLYRELRERGLVTSVVAGHFTPTEVGVFAVTADLDPARLDQTIGALAGEIARLAAQGPTSEELERARTLVLTRWMRAQETMDGRASALAGAEALRSVDLLDQEYQALASLDAEAVRQAAATYLAPDAVAVLAYVPRESGEDLTVSGVSKLFAGAAPVGRSAGSARSPAPASPRKAIGAEQEGVWHVALPGADLLIRPKRGIPTVTLGLYTLRESLDPPELAGLGALVVRSAVRGAGDLDGGALATALERLGGSLGTSIALDWLGFTTTVLADRLAEAASLLDLVCRSPTLDEAEVASERRLMVEEARQVTDDMFRYPFQLAFRAAFGDAGYGLPVGGLPETLDRITAADVRRGHERTLASQRITVVAVGDIDPEPATSHLAGIFGDRAARPRLEQLPKTSWAAGPRPRELAEPRQKAQSALALVFPGPSRRDPERHAAEIWAAIASGLGGRLFEALRDRRSLAYSVLGSAWQRGRAGALVTYIATSPEREAEARQAMLEELERFGREGVTDSELARAIHYLAGQAQIRRQSGQDLAAEIAEAWLIGNGLADLTDPAAQYRAVSRDSVQALIEANLRPSLRVEGVVRGSVGRPAGAREVAG